jgi:hypothetical protein
VHSFGSLEVGFENALSFLVSAHWVACFISEFLTAVVIHLLSVPCIPSSHINRLFLSCKKIYLAICFCKSGQSWNTCFAYFVYEDGTFCLH